MLCKPKKCIIQYIANEDIAITRATLPNSCFSLFDNLLALLSIGLNKHRETTAKMTNAVNVNMYLLHMKYLVKANDIAIKTLEKMIQSLGLSR